MSIEPDWEKKLKGKPFRKLMFTADMWDRWENRVSSDPKRPGKPVLRRSAVIMVVLAALLTVCLVGIRFEPGLLRSAGVQFSGLFESKVPVTDTAKPEELPAVASLGPQQLIHTIVNDAMAWGAHFGQGEPVVVDRDYYRTRSESSDHPVARGDIVYFETAAEDAETAAREPHDIARVIGLPGETVRIAKGRIYIDGRPLEAFYGTENRGRKDVKRISGTDQEVKLGLEQYYLLGDIWWRSYNDSQMHGAFAMQSILGKVTGYYSPPDIRHTEWTELYREDNLTIKAARLNSGVYKRYLVEWGGESKEFYWTGSTDPSYPPAVTMTDLDGDGEDEAVIALVIGTGTETVQSEVHALRWQMSEIPVADPVIAAKAAAQAAEIKRSSDKVKVKLDIGGKTIEQTYDADDAGLWFDEPGIGAVVYYRVEDGQLMSDMSVFASPATYVATITAKYRMKDGALVPSVFSAEEGE